MTPLNITVPDSALSALRRSPTEFGREMKLAAAIHWYQRGVMSQERAAELAGLNRRDFIRARWCGKAWTSLSWMTPVWHGNWG